MTKQFKTRHLTIPQTNIGPLLIHSPEFSGKITVPLATYESPLWPSTHRGALVSQECGGITVAIMREGMTRSVVVQAPSMTEAVNTQKALLAQQDDVANAIASTSRFCRLQSLHCEVLGDLLYIRLNVFTGDAAGHNMVTKAADHFLRWLLSHYNTLRYTSLSANYCVDKKTSAINGLLGRGKHVLAEINIPRSICQRILKTTPEALVDLHVKKNLLGSQLAGSLRSANAHFANILLAFYLATGQDAANIVEGSQGLVHAAVKNEALYFSVSIPNVIVGTVGNGKTGPDQQANLTHLGCLPDPEKPGFSARKLAVIAGATVLAGELSLLAALTNQGELMQAHERYERTSEPLFSTNK